MAVFEYRQAEEIREVFHRHQIRYLFIGKSGAILLGFPDTTQDADLTTLSPAKQRPTGKRIVNLFHGYGPSANTGSNNAPNRSRSTSLPPYPSL